MNRNLTALAALAIVSGFLVWWFQPSQALKRRTNGLMETLTLAEHAGPASRNLKINPLSAAIADEIEILGAGDRRAEGTFSRSDIEAGFAGLAKLARSTRFRILGFDDVTVRGDTGTVRARVDARVELEDRRPLDGTYQVTLVWRKEDGTWRLTRAEWSPL